MTAPPAAGVAHVVVEDDVPVARDSGTQQCYPGPTAYLSTRTHDTWRRPARAGTDEQARVR
jgi:hypothetical protein